MNMMREGNVFEQVVNPFETQRQRDFEKFSELLERELPVRKELLSKKRERALAAMETEQPKPHQIVINKEGKDFVYKQPETGQKTKITWGQIMTGTEWGIDYFLKQSIGKQERRAFIEHKFDVAEEEFEYEEDLISELQTRLADPSLARAPETVAFRAMHRTRYSEEARRQPEYFQQPGVLAEKIARVFLTRLGFDFPELHLKVKAVSPLDDVNKKIDFVVYHQKVPQDLEGVKIEELPETEENKAKSISFKRKLIQFTTNPHAREHKEKQMRGSQFNREGEKVTIVSIEMSNIKKLFADWERKRPHEKMVGPEEFLPKNIKEALFREVMSGILKPEEIETICTKL